jgi:hypothetical protein
MFSTNKRYEKCIQNCGLKTLEERPLGRHGSRWENNVQIYLKEVYFESKDCNNLTQDRVE